MSATPPPDSATVPAVDRVRETMSFSNILTEPSSTSATDVAVKGAGPTPPFTPAESAASAELEEQQEVQTTMRSFQLNTVTNIDCSITQTGDAVDTAMTDVSPTYNPEDPDDFPEDDPDAEDVPDSEREFICKNDETSRCITGQYTKVLSRKVISDHFGRNKACTRDITDWPLFCRKHYQRATYNKQLWQIRKLNLIFRQFDVIENQFPGTTYDIHFKKSEEARLNEYSRKVAAGKSEDEAAKAVAPKEGKHFEAPIAILRELDLDLGYYKSINEVKEITQKILKQITDGATLQVPAIEFLPNLPGRVSSPSKKKVPKTPSPKKASVPKTPTSKGTPGRLSAKGSVQKPGQN